MSKTNINDFINQLNAGVFKDKAALVLSEAALGTVLHGHGKRKGEVTIKLTLQQVGDNEQIIISHKISHKTPTKRGFKSEEDTTETPMFVGKGGVMSVTQQIESISGQANLTPVATLTPSK